MKIADFEKRLQEHAKITKSIIAAPFDIESEEINMLKKKQHSIKRTILIAAVIVCLIGATVFAAFHLLSAKDAANRLGDTKLAKCFSGQQGALSDTVSDGEYKAAVLGITSGKNLSKFKSSSWKVFPERTYAVVAVEKTDGTPMTFDDQILVTPLIEGLNPWQYNIFTMNGGYTADIIDGVLYRIIEFDNIEIFADRNVYMAVLSEQFLDNTSYSFDEKTGSISPKEDYKGTNILIKLKLDKSKANPKKAAEYLNKLNETEETADATDTTDETNETENNEDVETKEIVITSEMVENAKLNAGK